MEYSKVEQMFKEKNYAFFKGNLNLNLFAIRKKINTDVFDDVFGIAYEDDNGVKRVIVSPCTTEAGRAYLTAPVNKKGTAIIYPGQYRGAYEIGRHTTYTALRQCKEITYYERDNNKDSKHDLKASKTFKEIAYTNIHKAGEDSTYVSKNSAGCVVFKRSKDFDKLMELVHKSAKKYGKTFTFTLFEEL